jgi:uncharacterized protein (TIGR03663 family)
MKWPMKFLCAASAVLIVAVALRAWRLDIRPMHGDEAVHAYKFGRLLEENYYRYDPREFHGPTLNYFTLIPAWLSGKHTYASVTESTLRVVPVFFGLLLVVMPLLLAGGLGRPAALVAAAITAISPAFVFYSRYYIQEMLIACFTFGVISAGYKYARSRKVIWALLAGVFAGLCHATKETCLIAFCSMLIALLLTLLVRYRNPPGGVNMPGKIRAAHLVAAAVLAICVSGLFFSSFFKNSAGVLDSFRTYAMYFSRVGNNQHHVHPWYYYLQTLLYSKSATGPPWTEASVVILAAVGVILIVARKGLGKLDVRLLDFLVLYTGFMLVVYSAIPYKTPWCLLSFYHGMILLAAVGIVAILNLLGRILIRVVVAAIFLAVATDLGLQAFLASTVCYADLSNPYVYSQPTDDVLKIATRVEQVSDAYPARRQMPVFVVCPDGDYWPLPWYLRSFKNVGWWNDVNEIGSPAPVVIASPVFESRLITRLYDLSPPGRKNLYVPLFDAYVELRPGVELRGYVTKDLRDQYQQQNAGR